MNTYIIIIILVLLLIITNFSKYIKFGVIYLYNIIKSKIDEAFNS